jgi:hypothetical protein
VLSAATLGVLGISPPVLAQLSSPPPVRALALPAELDAAGMLELATEMRLAGQQAVVLVQGPASARVSGPVPEDVLEELHNAAAGVQLDVLVEPGNGDPGDAAAFVSAFDADHVYVQPGASVGALAEPDLRDRVAGLTQCAAPCQPTEPIADRGELMRMLGDPIPLDGSLGSDPLPTKGGAGIDPKLIAAPAIVLIGLAVAFLLAARRPRQAPAPRPDDVNPSSAPPAPRPPRRHPRPTTPHDPSLPSSGRALVHSELHPDGYVELDGCLRRVRWAGSGAPPAPGESVRVESHGGRLVARPGRSR